MLYYSRDSTIDFIIQSLKYLLHVTTYSVCNSVVYVYGIVDCKYRCDSYAKKKLVIIYLHMLFFVLAKFKLIKSFLNLVYIIFCDEYSNCMC